MFPSTGNLANPSRLSYVRWLRTLVPPAGAVAAIVFAVAVAAVTIAIAVTTATVALVWHRPLYLVGYFSDYR
jgi:hypothetical protein